MALVSADACALPLPKLEDQALRILVVDDNAMNLMVARLQLQKCWPHAQVVTADRLWKELKGFRIALIR